MGLCITIKFYKKMNKELSISEVIDYLIEKFSTQVRIKNGREVIGSTNAKDYKMLKNSLEKFVSEKYKKPLTSYQFQDIDTHFLIDYISFLERRAATWAQKVPYPTD